MNETWLPKFLAMGMRASEFWQSTAKQLRPYLLAHDIELEEKNYLAWLQGLYFCSALNTVIGNAFGGKGQEKLKYIEEPIRLTPLSAEEEKARCEKERQKAFETFRALEMRYGDLNTP